MLKSAPANDRRRLWKLVAAIYVAVSVASVWLLWGAITRHTTELYHVFSGSTEDVLRTFDLANFYLEDARAYLDDPRQSPDAVLARLTLLLGRKEIILSHTRISVIGPEFLDFLETNLTIFHETIAEVRDLLRTAPLDDEATVRAESLIFNAEETIRLIYAENDRYVKHAAIRVKTVLDTLMFALLGFAALQLILLGGIAALWQKSRRQEAQMKELALRDPLTGLHNRRYFDEVCAHLLHVAWRGGQPLGLIAIDVDHFKPFNDTYGHDKGDIALTGVAGVLRAASARRGDLAFRIGGEEFCCLIPDGGHETLRRLAERIRSGIQALDIPHAASATSPRLTISIGIAEALTSGAHAPADLYAFADRALYRAKNAGRDRIHVFTPEPNEEQIDAIVSPTQPRDATEATERDYTPG